MLFYLLRKSHFLSNLLPALPCGKRHFLRNSLTKGNSWLELGRIPLGKHKDLQNQISPEASYGLEVIFLFLLTNNKKITHMLMVRIKCSQMKLGMYLWPNLTFWFWKCEATKIIDWQVLFSCMHTCVHTHTHTHTRILCLFLRVAEAFLWLEFSCMLHVSWDSLWRSKTLFLFLLQLLQCDLPKGGLIHMLMLIRSTASPKATFRVVLEAFHGVGDIFLQPVRVHSQWGLIHQHTRNGYKYEAEGAQWCPAPLE